MIWAVHIAGAGLKRNESTGFGEATLMKEIICKRIEIFYKSFLAGISWDYFTKVLKPDIL